MSIKLASVARAEFGTMRPTDANRLVLGHFLRKHVQLEYPDMRACDRHRHIPLAIELALTPTREDVEATKYSRSATARSRRQLADLPQ